MTRMEMLEKVERLMSSAWTLVYDESKGEHTGTLHDLRMEINSAECKLIEAIEEEEAK